jgi:tetratricopeptide (TPR) repeat protein
MALLIYQKIIDTTPYYIKAYHHKSALLMSMEQYLEASIVFNKILKINPDYYNILFKPLCLGHTMKWLAALRSKYEGLATPIGELRINWQQLEQNGDRIIQETTVKLEEILPDHFLEII